MYIKIFDGLDQYSNRLVSELHMEFYDRVRSLNSDQRIATHLPEIYSFIRSTDFVFVFNRYLITCNNESAYFPDPWDKQIKLLIHQFFESEEYKGLIEPKQTYWERQCDGLRL